MSLVITLMNLGLVASFMQIWLQSWAISLAIAFPATLLVTPAVKVMVKLVINFDTMGPLHNVTNTDKARKKQAV